MTMTEKTNIAPPYDSLVDKLKDLPISRKQYTGLILNFGQRS